MAVKKTTAVAKKAAPKASAKTTAKAVEKKVEKTVKTAATKAKAAVETATKKVESAKKTLDRSKSIKKVAEAVKATAKAIAKVAKSAPKATEQTDVAKNITAKKSVKPTVKTGAKVSTVKASGTYSAVSSMTNFSFSSFTAYSCLLSVRGETAHICRKLSLSS